MKFVVERHFVLAITPGQNHFYSLMERIKVIFIAQSSRANLFTLKFRKGIDCLQATVQLHSREKLMNETPSKK